jgi:hypothetical protein
MVTMMRLLAAVPVIAAVGALAVGTAPGADAGTASPAAPAILHGTWQKLPAAPVRQLSGSVVSLWTGREMIIHGNATTFAYRPATRTWVRLANGPRQATVEGIDVAVWTGSRMLVIGLTNASYNPVTNTWAKIPAARMPMGVTGWTGRQFLTWGGTCCMDTSRDGAAYNPVTSTWRKLPTAPLQSRADAEGAWTGKELIVAGGFTWVGDREAGFRDGAAYNPATSTWRKIALMPATINYPTGPAVWDGTEVLFLRSTGARGLAYNPVTNRWRYLPAMPQPRADFAAVWTGHYVLVWGGIGGTSGKPALPAHGEAYSPVTNQWTAMPGAPVPGRAFPTAVWTGHQMIVWGGWTTTSYFDGAAFTPR